MLFDYYLERFGNYSMVNLNFSNVFLSFNEL